MYQDNLAREKYFNGYKPVYINLLGDLKLFEVVEYDNFNMKKYKGYYDVYTTENTMDNIYTRSNRDVLQLRSLYIDLDNIIDIDKTIENINSLVSKNKIPLPTQIIFSGRGLHVKWTLKDYAGINKNIKAWEKLQEYLYKTLKDYGADARAKDVVRILRIPGTINSKSDKKVEILVENENAIYDLYELCKKYIPYEATGASKKPKRKGKVKLLTTKQTLNNARLIDLEKLLELREYDMTDIRNSFLMFYTTYYILVNKTDFDDTLQAVKRVASRIKSKHYTSLSEMRSFVRNGLKKVEEHNQGQKVLPKSETIIKYLNISEDEQLKLNTIKSTRIKYDIKNNKRNAARRNKDGLTTREQQKQELINKVKELKEQGLNNTKIAEKLSISRVYVSKIINGKV